MEWATKHEGQPVGEPVKEPKLVVAHFMVGNTYPYALLDWTDDIRLARSYGLDGFALNVGCEDWVLERVSDCFNAAALSSTGFQLFISFDMSSFKFTCLEDINSLKVYAGRFFNHPNYLKIKGRVLVSTFSGEMSFFGQESLEEAWSAVKRELSEDSPIHFLPAFFVDPRRYHELHCMDGAFHWNGGWPVHLKPHTPRHEVRCPNLTSDQEYMRHLHRKTYMAAVSPWFFTHYGKDSWNKNWIYRGDDWLLVRRWEYLISIRDQVDIVQVISWNDYGESHYIGPIKGAQPNSEAWVNGFDHLPWLRLNAYFAEAFRTGRYPALEEDLVYVWARPHVKGAVASNDSVDRPDNWQLTDDEFWIVILATEAATVQLWSDLQSKPLGRYVQTGVNKLSCPLVRGGGIRVKLVRSEKTVIDFHPSGYKCDPNPEAYNFNAFVGTYPPVFAPH